MAFPAESALSGVLAPLGRYALDELLGGLPRRDFQVRLWDGSTWGEVAHPRFTLVIKNREALRRMLFSADELSLGEAYIYDGFDVEGDMEAAFELTEHLVQRMPEVPRHPILRKLLNRSSDRANRRNGDRVPPLTGELHSKERDRQAIRYHYDLPPEFYALFLDSTMMYSCAYFSAPGEDLETAQLAKLDYLCRKLRLQPGERLLDVGCGWGGLVMHAASRYGVQALGITASVRQAEFARRRIQQAGLAERCRVEVCDYRDLEGEARFDKIVSVGMFEHVGEALLPEYFARAWRLLRPKGVFVNHGIAASATYRRKGESFIGRYVFPDGELVPIHMALRAAETSGFEVRDLESLREHYALTLHYWVQRLQEHAGEARRIADDVTYRIWRLYMAGCAHAFRKARVNLYQVLLAKSQRGDSGLPLTRADWYCA